MISFDTNLLFPALEPSHGNHAPARSFVESLPDQGVALSELVLMELFVLLRNPVTCSRPLAAPEAVDFVHRLRTNPRWLLLDCPAGLMDEIWSLAARPDSPRRRIFDIRLAISLLRQGVTQFATANVPDFEDVGFERVWNPLAAP